MKLATVNIIAGILSSAMNISKIPNKKVKATLYNDYRHLRGFVKKAEEERQEIVKKFQDDWKDELAAVEAFRQENKPVEGHDDYLEAEKDANEAIAAIFNEDVETSIKPISMDDFWAYCGNEDLTFEQIAFLQDNGIIEE